MLCKLAQQEQKANALKEAGIVKQVKTYDTIDVLMAELAKGTVDGN